MTTTTASLDELVARYAELNARQAELLDEMNTIKADIRDHFDDGTYEAAGCRVTIRQPNRTLDLDKAVELLPPDVRKLCETVAYDRKRVLSYLPPAVADLAYKPGSGQRVVTIA